jgi:hypothetical protein
MRNAGHQADVGVEAPCQSPLSGVVEVDVDALSGQCDDSRSWPRDHRPGLADATGHDSRRVARGSSPGAIE